MNYGDLIRDAFWITWRNKFLWFFGFFVAGGSSFNVPAGGGNFDRQDGVETASVPAFAAQVGQVGAFEGAAFIALVVLGILITLVFIVLVLISTGALADSVAAIDGGEGRRFSPAFRAGVSNFWRVLGQALLFILIALGLLVIIGIPVGLLIGGTFVATDSIGLRVLFTVLGALLGIALAIIFFIPLAVIGQYALRELVVGGERISASIGNGYRLFRRNIGRSLLLWLIQLGIMLGAGIALLLATLIVGFVLFLPTILLAVVEQTTAAIVVGVVAGVIVVLLFFVASAALGTFNHAYWTLAYLRLTSQRPDRVA